MTVMLPTGGDALFAALLPAGHATAEYYSSVD